MKSFIRSAIWRLSLAAIVVIGLVALFGRGPAYFSAMMRGSQEVQVYSSRKSPNGSRVAESVGLGSGSGDGGRLTIRAKDGSEHSIGFPEPPVGIFFLWEDETHLSLSSFGAPIDLHNTDRLGDVRLQVRSHQFSKPPTYEVTGAVKIEVSQRNAIATFAQAVNENGRTCTLKIGALPGVSASAASVDIAAVVDAACQHQQPCLEILTMFTLEDNRDLKRQSALTSATVADIPSYNRLPTGDRGTQVRGQFLGESAVRLMEALDKPSVTLNFSRDFFGQVVTYDVPLSGNASVEFKRCIGDAVPH